MKYTVVIVEDEKHQQAHLEQMLQKYPDLEIVDAASSIAEAKASFTQNKPDLVFLDVMLPPYTSFDLIQDYYPLPFQIIFTTSYEEYAVKAFRLSAVDYLIKPIIAEELDQAIQRFYQRMQTPSSSHLEVLLTNLQLQNEREKKIALPTLTGYIFVTISDIVRCESDNTYTTFFLLDKRKILISKTLKDCENMLSDFSFCRVHNTSLINLEYIVEYTKGEGGSVKLIDGTEVDVSRRRKEDFMRTFNRIGLSKK